MDDIFTFAVYFLSHTSKIHFLSTRPKIVHLSNKTITQINTITEIYFLKTFHCKVSLSYDKTVDSVCGGASSVWFGIGQIMFQVLCNYYEIDLVENSDDFVVVFI